MSRQARRQGERARIKQSARARKGPPRRRSNPSRLVPRGLLGPLGIGLVVVAVIGFIGWAIVQQGGGSSTQSAAAAAEQDQNPNLPGQWIDPGAVYPNTGAHVAGTVPFCQDTSTSLDAEGKVTCYHSNPPTSGPHSPTDVAWDVYDQPVPKEQLVHNMEHGGVIVWYNCTNCDDLVAQVKSVVEQYLKDGKEVVMSPYPGMEENTIALTAWSRLDKFPTSDYTDDRLRRFVDAHERRFNPEKF
jgi:hypothetical protein